MYQSNQMARRRKKRVLQGCKTVTVVRGKLGYGFTISGQNPCMLSCIVPNSPADQAGLKPGDLLYCVNGQNVSRFSHDDVVRMVGLSTGALDLQVAENCNSSDSSDDDYPPRSKSRYPNRVRPRQSVGDKAPKHEMRQEVIRQERKHSKDSGSTVQHGDVDSDLSSSVTSQEEVPWSSSRRDVDWRSKRNERQQPRGKADSNDRQSSGFAYPSMHNSGIRKVMSASAVVKKVPQMTGAGKSSQSVHAHHSSKDQHRQSVSRSNVRALSTIQASPQIEASPVHKSDMSDVEDMPEVMDTVQAVVGYTGSIETPSSHTRPHQRLQALRNAVRRLRVEQRVHTLVLMEVNPQGVVLTNGMGKQLAFYPSERIAFSGICPDDKRFFGLVTLSCQDDDSSSYAGEGSSRLPNSSCHIFMIEPDLSSHSAHVNQADMFQVRCTTNPQTRRCDEFPSSATSLILCIANLYRHGPPRQFDSEIIQSQALADPVPHHHQGNNSATSTSDSGLGIGREDPLEQNEQVCVVDVPSADKENASIDASSCSSLMMDTSCMSLQHTLSPELRPPGSTQRPLSAFDVRRGLNNSTSSEEWMVNKASNRLTPRAMPDPACSPPHNSPVTPSAESLRQSMQRLLQARQQQLHEQNQRLGSDGESMVGEPVMSLSMAADGYAVLETGPRLASPVFAVPTAPAPHSSASSSVRSAFQVPRPVSVHVPRPVSAPLGTPLRSYHPSQAEMVEMETAEDKLSPRAFPRSTSSSSMFRSPSAPPAPFFPHCDTDDDDEDEDSEDDPYIRQILDQFSRDRREADAEDSRRYSESFAMAKRYKHRMSLISLQRAGEPSISGRATWSKAGGQQAFTQLKKQSFSQSHESLPVVEEPALSSNHKLIASSVNNVSGQPAAQPHIEAQGRVASWAVHIDRLLHDPIGVNIFTEFLQKEFSEENILFWQACQQYRLIHDEAKRMSESAALWTRFLSPTADDPVNVDSSAKSAAEKYLDNPTPNMFDVAQRQIYQLMRQDSYSRFIKSDMYKGRVMKEMEGKPLEGGEGRGEGGKTVKAAKLTKNKSENRRRSILPWRQNKKGSIKTKSDSELKGSGKVSKDEAEKDSTPATTSITTPNNNNIHNASNASSGSNGVTTVSTSTGKISKGSSSNSLNSNNNNNNNNVPNHKKTAGPGIDLSTMRKEVFHPRESRDAPPSHFKFCRIVMPDGSTTVVCAKPGQSSRTVLGKLCEKRSVSLAAMDVFLLGSDQPLDLSEDISTLGSKEIVIERRVLFRLDLPSGKCIGVKAKPNRSIREVFRPILSKYGLRMDAVAIHLLDSPVPVDQDTAVSDIDNKRVIVVEEGSGSQKRRGPFFGLIRPSEKRVSGVKAKSQEQTEQGQGHLCPKD